MMVLPSGIKVFWPLMTCTPRLNMFGNDKADSLICLNTLKIVCFGIKRGGATVLSHYPPSAYLGTSTKKILFRGEYLWDICLL